MRQQKQREMAFRTLGWTLENPVLRWTLQWDRSRKQIMRAVFAKCPQADSTCSGRPSSPLAFPVPCSPLGWHSTRDGCLGDSGSRSSRSAARSALDMDDDVEASLKLLTILPEDVRNANIIHTHTPSRPWHFKLLTHYPSNHTCKEEWKPLVTPRSPSFAVRRLTTITTSARRATVAWHLRAVPWSAAHRVRNTRLYWSRYLRGRNKQNRQIQQQGVKSRPVELQQGKPMKVVTTLSVSAFSKKGCNICEKTGLDSTFIWGGTGRWIEFPRSRFNGLVLALRWDVVK